MLAIERVAPDVVRIHMTTRRSRAAGYGVSAYLTRGVLIDTGFSAVGAEFARWLGATRPRGALLTHHHEDHSGNLDRLLDLDIPIGAAAATIGALGHPMAMGLYRQVVWGRPRRADIAAVAARRFEEPALALIHTPGHSDDHHVVWDAERETVYAGDLFLGIKVRVARPEEDPRALVRSLRRTMALQPRLLFDAHRGPVPDPVGALGAKVSWLDDVIGAIDQRVADGWSDRAIARQVLGREGITHYVSAGDLSNINFVRAVRRADKQMTQKELAAGV